MTALLEKTNATAGTFVFGTGSTLTAVCLAAISGRTVSVTTNNSCYGCTILAVGCTAFNAYQATKNVTAITLNCTMKVGTYAIDTTRCITAADANRTGSIGGYYSCTGTQMATVGANPGVADMNSSTLFIVHLGSSFFIIITFIL